MGLKDIFNASKIKEENENLKSLMTPEMQKANALLSKINELQQETDRLTKEINRKQFAVNSLEKDAAELQKKIITFNDDILVQEFGLYHPRYHFDSSSIYAQNLVHNREQQKALLKSNMAATGNMNFTYNNSKAQGNKMVKDMQKLLLRAFNSECDEIIRNVKYNNYDMSLRKLTTSSEAISKLGTMLMISITPAYFALKKQELDLTIEYKIQQQEEKEALKAARAEQREQAKVQKEIEAQRKKIEKELSHYQTAFERLNSQLELHPDDPDLLNKKTELEDKLATPISNGGLMSAPPGHGAGYALRAGFATPLVPVASSWEALSTLLFCLFLLGSVYILVLSLHSHFLLMPQNILLPRNVYLLCFCIPDVCQTTSAYSSPSNTT